MATVSTIAAAACWAALVLVLVLRTAGGMRHRPARIGARFALFSLLFVAPLGDELLAWPQLRRLCTGEGRFEYGPGMDEQAAFGRTVYYRPSAAEETQTVFPGIPVRLSFHDYVDAHSGDVVLRFRSVLPLGSMFAYPDAKGVRHPWLLRECWGANLSGVPDERALKLVVVRAPPLPARKPRPSVLEGQTFRVLR